MTSLTKKLEMSISRVGTEVQRSWGSGWHFCKFFGPSPHGCKVAAAARDITSSQNGIQIRNGGGRKESFTSFMGEQHLTKLPVQTGSVLD